MVSVRTHNILDYVGAAVLVLSPFLFGFSDVETARNVFLFCGFGLALYSLITRYPISIAKIIPLGVHMVLDVLAGLFLMIAPSLFNYREFLTDLQYGLHFVLGIGVIGLVAVTRRKTESGTLADIGINRTGMDVDTTSRRDRDRVAFP
jgi:hypothetical protein